MHCWALPQTPNHYCLCNELSVKNAVDKLAEPKMHHVDSCFLMKSVQIFELVWLLGGFWHTMV